MARKQFNRRCSFEALERRRLLAGDVLARIDDGTLVINGDDLDNGITITAGANAGQVIVTGVNAGGSATSVNGTANGAVTLSGFTGGIKITMKDGNDTVSISDLDVSGKAKIKGGDGNDTFAFEDMTFDRSFSLRLGKGSDTSSLSNVEVAGKAKIKGGRGEDDVTIEDSEFTRLKVSLQRDDDTLEIADTTVTEKTRLIGGKGVNTFINGSGNSLANLKQKHFVAGTAPSESPSLTLSGPSSVNEGALYTLNLAASGTGASTITQWSINWGDGTSNQVVNGNPTSVTHTFADGANTRTISATATTPNGTFPAGNTVGVTVNNVTPTLSISGATSVTRGALYTLNLSSSDPGTDTISQWTINWGDGTANQVVTGNPTSVTHTFAESVSSATVSTTATDEDGTFPAGNSVNVSIFSI